MELFQTEAITVKESTLNEGSNLGSADQIFSQRIIIINSLRTAKTGLRCAGLVPA